MANDLAIRFRPITISEVWGNDKAKNALLATLENKNRPQVYLFTGSAGCGKTTLARAYAHDLGATDVDITEHNMSDHTGVDDARSIVETSGYCFGDIQVTILDECHYMTANAQSCLLKLLEEPAQGSYYFLCTTDPQKLSTAIKSRCVQIVVAPLDEELLVKKLRKVCKEDNIDTSIEVLEAIAEKSEGVPRRALKLLDKVIGLDEDKALAIINDEKSGDAEDPDIKAICQELLKGGSWKNISSNLKNVKGSDVEGIRRMISGYMSAVLLNSGSKAAACVLSYFIENFYDSGYAGLVYACFCALTEIKNM